VQVLGVNLKDAAWFSAVPWAMMAAVGFVAGASSDVLVQWRFWG
jgi:ACS family sodium-dependent inorganic phosphate cotransporter